MTAISTTRIRALYERFERTSHESRERFGRPLTWAEKILSLHLHAPATRAWERGRDWV